MAFQKWKELKHILIDHEIYLSSCMKLLKACVRSCLLCSVQGIIEFRATEDGCDMEWFLRKTIARGYAWKMFHTKAFARRVLT